ncbi:MAG: DUF4412 domain-containing protein [Saprospiraceae bacterium]|jgi:hypothetical protein|nr:DUF4412 domain-containing protein [Saprospiraceae bacterium]
MKKLSLILCFLFIGLAGAYSQYVKIGVSSVKADNAEMQQQMDASLKSMKMETYASPDKVRTDVNMMGGMVMMSTFSYPDKEDFIMYMDLMGSKTKVVPTAEEIKKITEDANKKSGDYKITKVSGETKTILGFQCQKYNISSPDMQLTMYLTPEIKIKANKIQGMEGLKLDGYPLEYTINTMGAKMTFTAEKFEKTFDASKLNPPSGNYKEVNFTDFQKQMPGM